MIKIVVAEDELKIREALVSHLNLLLGEEVMIESAEDGNEAVDKCLQVRPQLVLMDIEMPGKNGIEAAMLVKKQLPDTHVVFLTAYDRFEYAVGAIRSGAEEYLLKPVSDEDLMEVLHRLLGVEHESASSETPFMSELKLWVQKNYKNNISLEDAAESMGLSPFYFSRQVKAQTGNTFMEYLTAYRLKKAESRLSNTEMPVTEIGKSVGYLDPNYFTKVFKKAFGVTPTMYRNRQNKKGY